VFLYRFGCEAKIQASALSVTLFAIFNAGDVNRSIDRQDRRSLRGSALSIIGYARLAPTREE